MSRVLDERMGGEVYADEDLFKIKKGNAGGEELKLFCSAKLLDMFFGYKEIRRR